MHIGLIGGIGPAATDFYYRGLIQAHRDSGHALELTIVHADVHELVRNVTSRDARAQARTFLKLIERLKSAGARAAAITSMGGHFCIGEVLPASPLPLVNLIPELGAEIERRGLKTVGIIGTRVAMETRAYGGITSADVVLPEGAALDETHKAYVEMGISGRVTEAQRRHFFAVGRHLCQAQGAEAVILGGTDLFLAFEGRDPGFPVIDCAEVHIAALHRRSVSDA
jgi:aspartate racemase